MMGFYAGIAALLRDLWSCNYSISRHSNAGRRSYHGFQETQLAVFGRRCGEGSLMVFSRREQSGIRDEPFECAIHVQSMQTIAFHKVAVKLFCWIVPFPSLSGSLLQGMAR